MALSTLPPQYDSCLAIFMMDPLDSLQFIIDVVILDSTMESRLRRRDEVVDRFFITHQDTSHESFINYIITGFTEEYINNRSQLGRQLGSQLVNAYAHHPRA